jgi:hypothetical protein
MEGDKELLRRWLALIFRLHEDKVISRKETEELIDQATEIVSIKGGDA